MIGATSLFGLELDSIADVVTFGCAATLLAYAWGIGSLPDMQVSGFLITFLFVACGALRLARSNLHAHAARAIESSSRPADEYFVGLPIPAAAGMIAAIVHFSPVPLGARLATGAINNAEAQTYSLALILITALLALLMVSTFPYSKLKLRHAGNRSLGVLNVLIFPAIACLIAAGVWFNSRWVVLIIATLYVAHGPLLKLGRLFKTPARVRSSSESQIVGASDSN